MENNAKIGAWLPEDISTPSLICHLYSSIHSFTRRIF